MSVQAAVTYFSLDSLYLRLRSPHLRALLPAFAGGIFVNGPRKTNATFGVACFSFGPIIPYTKVTKNNLFCYDFFNFFPSSTASVKTSPL